ncbi:MAG: VWA domain-containing protein [Candidatus Nanopelagicales bacterium]
MSRFRYGAYREGPDPLAAPYDAGRAVDELGERILDGSSVRDALRDLMRRGADGLRGLDDLMRRARQRRRELQRSGRLDGTLEEVRRLLDEAVDAERRELFPDPSDDARFREAQLDALPDDAAGAVRELAEYDWRSAEARQSYEQIRDLLRREVLDQQFAGMKRSLQDPADPAAQQALKDMLADLNALLEKKSRGEDTEEDFAEFMRRHGGMFPSDPQDLDELLDDLARRAAAAQRLMDSLSPEQRAELQDLIDQAMSDLDLAAEMGRLQDNLRALRPDLPWQGRQRMDGDEGLGLGDATGALADLADVESLERSLRQDYAGASLQDVDEDAVRRALGRQSVDDLRRLQEVERELERQGFLTRSGGRVELTPKAMRRLGQTALRRVFASLESGRRGDHDVRDAGAAGEFTGTTREWRFGDEQPIDVVRTVGNAVRRHVTTRSDDRVRLTADDFEVRETERRTRAAVALLVDQSFSMVMNDTWRAAKTTAMALHALATAQFPQDAVQVVAFANMARVIRPHDLPDLDASDIQGTNLQHALMLAGRFLDRHRDAEPVLIVITDGEPTAHIDRDGEWRFSWPPSQQTVDLTVAEVDRLTRRGVPISWFRLGDDPRLERFLDAMARRNGGRVLSASGERLGDVVVTDYLRRRRGRRASA